MSRIEALGCVSGRTGMRSPGEGRKMCAKAAGCFLDSAWRAPRAPILGPSVDAVVHMLPPPGRPAPGHMDGQSSHTSRGASPALLPALVSATRQKRASFLKA